MWLVNTDHIPQATNRACPLEQDPSATLVNGPERDPEKPISQGAGGTKEPVLPVMTLLTLAFQPAEIVFVRHGETVANATGRYKTSTLNAFSQKGLNQVARLTAKLQGNSFDDILVSPSPRALKTVAPYLQRTDQVAEVWPELYECCVQKGAAKQKPAAPSMQFGSEIAWPETFDGLFRFRPGANRYILAPTFNDGRRQIKLAWQMLLEEFSGTGKRILIVGHSGQGGEMISMLTGGRRISLANAKPVRLIETRPGLFTIL
jgi:broad specificity phosphatase PhoE